MVQKLFDKVLEHSAIRPVARSTVEGEVMSSEDIVEAQAKRDAKEVPIGAVR